MRIISATARTRFVRSAGGTLFMRRPNSIFCATVLCGNSAWLWNTMPRPRSRGSRSLTTRPSMRISPAVGSSKPAIMRKVVVLPQPDGPTKTTNSPSSITMLRFLTATTGPKTLCRLLSSMRANSFSVLFLSAHHAEAESAHQMLTDDQPDDHERHGDADRQRGLPAID